MVLSVGPEEVKAAKKYQGEEWLNSTVQLGDANGGGMMATLEMFHQLHCLVRMADSIVISLLTSV